MKFKDAETNRRALSLTEDQRCLNCATEKLNCFISTNILIKTLMDLKEPLEETKETGAPSTIETDVKEEFD
jgi:cytochrome c-type biogenesis protein CcmH/NrfF